MKASAGIYLPSDHRLLASARMALHEDDYRKAVIDAGTATEVALATVITDILRKKKVDDDFINAAISAANGLTGLISMYTSLGYSPPVSKNKATNQLAEVRNKAAHAGQIPVPDEAILAVQHAHKLVNFAHPLPVL